MNFQSLVPPDHPFRAKTKNATSMVSKHSFTPHSECNNKDPVRVLQLNDAINVL